MAITTIRPVPFTNRTISAKSTHSYRLDSDGVFDHTLKLQNWICDKTLRSIQRGADEEMRAVNNSTNEILDREATLVKSASEILDHRDLCSRRKVELTNLRWNRTVFEPLCERIDSSMRERNNTQDLHKAKQRLHQDYIDHINKKGFVSLEVISPDDYYPFKMQTIPRSQTAPAASKSPPSLSERKRDEEDLLLLRCQTGRQFGYDDLKTIRKVFPVAEPTRSAPSKEEVGWPFWNALPLHQIDSSLRERSRRRYRGNFNFATVHRVICDEQAYKSSPPSSSKHRVFYPRNKSTAISIPVTSIGGMHQHS